VQASGTRTYVGYNTLVGNELGFSTSSRGSLYERNVAANNELGARATTVVPSSRIVANDFVGNADHATAGAGALRVWADGDRGNYWGGANVGVHEPGERVPPPTAPVDAALHREVAAVAVRESPAVALLDRLRGPFPGRARGASSIRRRRRSRTRRTGSTPRSTRTRDRSVPTGAPNWATVARERRGRSNERTRSERDERGYRAETAAI